MLIEHLENSLENANRYKSNITLEILDLEGMTGKKTRNFYNNLCSMSDARYLEIGSWKGSSLCSAMCNNNMTCLAIDNWSEFSGPKNEFLDNFNKFKGRNNSTFIEQDCWKVDITKIGKFNIYLYDGNHTETSHYEALNYYLPCLDNEFIYLVDDWNWRDVRNGTEKSIKDNNLEVIYKKEIKSDGRGPWKSGKPSGKDSDWHNGIGIFVLKKNKSFNLFIFKSRFKSRFKYK